MARMYLTDSPPWAEQVSEALRASVPPR